MRRRFPSPVIAFALAALSLVAVAPGAASQAQRATTPNAASRALAALAEDYWQWRLREYPEGATWLGDPRYNDRLTDLSPAAIDRRKGDIRRFRERAHAIDASKLGGQDLLSLELLRWDLDVAVDGQRFPTETMVLDQLDGPQLGVPQLTSVAPFRTAADYRAYFRRLEAYPRYLEQLTALLRSGIDRGWVQPNGPLRSVPEQISGQLDDDVTKSPFYGPLTRIPESVPAATRDSLQAAARTLIAQRVNPALVAFRGFVVGTYLPAGARPIAAETLPNGREFYAFAIKQSTTTALSADSIHALGLAEVARIRAQMDSVVRQTGFTGTFAEFLTMLRTDPRFYYTKPEELLTGYRDVAKRADGELPRLFAVLPRNSYGVEPFPDFEAPSQTTARYYSGAADGTRAGRYMVNLYRLDTRPKYEMEALTLHEAVPGHHLQISRAQELGDLPAFRRNAGYTSFVEGWALYAESLGPAMGFYRDPYSKFGQLTYEMWRACRLVVDTGMHHLGWTRQQAIDFMMQNSGKSQHDIEVEVDRYIVWPGQALAYKLGELRIQELRRRAERELGSRFDLRRFHNAVLDNGPLPLDVLERQIDRWIDAERTRAN
jgi:uncharacterized protein (DUF885 family)